MQNYDTSESKLRREFEVFGAIKKILVVNNPDTAKPRGYAFIEYEHERDMHCKSKNVLPKIELSVGGGELSFFFFCCILSEKRETLDPPKVYIFSTQMDRGIF